jgi:hypothetical protein
MIRGDSLAIDDPDGVNENIPRDLADLRPEGRINRLDGADMTA